MNTCEGSIQDVARHWKKAGSTLGGPEWHDIALLLRDLERYSGSSLLFEVESVKTPSGRWGLRVRLRMGDGTSCIASAGFGPAYPSGARTMEGCCFNVLWQGEQRLGIDEGDGRDLGGA